MMHLLPTRRHLAAEGTTFRLLVDEVRGALAEEMLSHRMSVAEVAERLGYAEVAPKSSNSHSRLSVGITKCVSAVKTPPGTTVVGIGIGTCATAPVATAARAG